MNDITFRPSSLNFNYTGSTASTMNVTTLLNIAELVENPASRINVSYNQSQYGWLKVYDNFNGDLDNQTVLEYLTSFKVTINTANPIPDGNYDAIINLVVGNYPPESFFTILTGGSMRVYLSVSAGVSSFTITPMETTLHLVKQNIISPSSTIAITTPGACIVEGSDKLMVNNQALPITISQNGNIVVTTSSSARSLPNGVYHDYALNFKNGSQQYGRLPVKLVVTTSNNLEIQPTLLTFTETKGISRPDWQNLYVYDPANNVTIDAPAWLRYELVSNENGFKTYAINVNSDNLAIGTRNELINFVSGSQAVACLIKYELKGLYNNNYERNFHFTQDNEYLELAQAQVDKTTFARVEMLIKFYSFAGKLTETTRTLEFFYYQLKMSDLDPGEIIHEMFRYYEDDNVRYSNLNESSGIVPQYQFASIYFNVSELDFDSREQYTSFVVPTQYYIKGQRPKYNDIAINGNTFLSNRIGEATRITTNSIISFNFLKISSGELKLKHNGVEIAIPNEDSFKEIPQAPDVKIFGGIIKVSDLENVQENDVLELEFASQKLIYVVEEEGLNTVNCFYLDEHDLLQSFELTGEYVIDSSYDRVTTTSFKKWMETTRNLSTSKVQNLKIESGYIPQENLKILDQIMMRKKAWLIIDGQTIEARPVLGKLNNISTKDNLHNRELEFELINQHYDSFYM